MTFQQLSDASPYKLDEILFDCCKDYYMEQLMSENDILGMEACEDYMNGKASEKIIKGLYKFFGIIPEPIVYQIPVITY